MCSRAQKWRRDVQRLAADDMEGRRAGTDGYLKAADYVVERVEQLGLRPGGTEGFLQPVAFQTRSLDEERSSGPSLQWPAGLLLRQVINDQPIFLIR